MISPQFRPLVGGYERAAERLCASLAASGVRVAVLTERRDRGWPARESLEGYEVRRLWCGRRRSLALALASLGWRLLREGRRFDVWHVHQYGAHAALASALGLLLRRPVVLKTTSSGLGGIARRLGGGPAGRALAFFHRRVAACVALSVEMRQEVLRFGIPAARIHLIPNGFDGTSLRPASAAERVCARRSLGLDCRRLLLFVGRLAEVKDPLLLLEAWSRVPASARRGSALALVGDGPLRPHVEAAACRPEIRGSVVVAGPRTDVEMWYRAADACVIPSRVEGLSNAMVEALAAGLPVVATRVSGASLLLGRDPAGLVVPVGDAAALADALETVLADEAGRARLGRRARRLFEEQFALENVRDRMLGLYGALAS